MVYTHCNDLKNNTPEFKQEKSRKTLRRGNVPRMRCQECDQKQIIEKINYKYKNPMQDIRKESIKIQKTSIKMQ